MSGVFTGSAVPPLRVNSDRRYRRMARLMPSLGEEGHT
jgi:hypothetical protein